MTAPLKPCPFCGGMANLVQVRADEDWVDTRVMCTDCFASSDVIESPRAEPEQATALWNARTPEPVEPAEAAIPSARGRQ